MSHGKSVLRGKRRSDDTDEMMILSETERRDGTMCWDFAVLYRSIGNGRGERTCESSLFCRGLCISPDPAVSDITKGNNNNNNNNIGKKLKR